MAKKTAVLRLDAAREALDAATKQIGEIEASRNAALLKDDDETAAKLFGDLEALRAVVHGHADKIALLDAEAKRERAEAIVRGHQALIGRFAKTLGTADESAEKAAEYFLLGWKEISKAIDLRERARAAFSVRSSHAVAAAEAIEGAAMSATAVMALLSFEFYRISAKPLLLGRPGERTRPPLPGAKSPRLEIMLQPEKITPLAEKLRMASVFAVKTLRDEIGNSGEVAAPADEQPPPTSAPPATNGSSQLRTAVEIQKEVQAEAEARDAMLAANTGATASKQNERAHTPSTSGADEQRERTPEQLAYSDLLRQMTEAASDTSDAGEKRYFAIMAQLPAAEAAANASIERTE